MIDPKIVDVLIEASARPARSALAELTPRERELLAEIAAGKSNGAIAETLVLTKRAVEKHVNSIFSKLGLPEEQDVSRRVKATLIYLSETDPPAGWLASADGRLANGGLDGAVFAHSHVRRGAIHDRSKRCQLDLSSRFSLRRTATRCFSATSLQPAPSTHARSAPDRRSQSWRRKRPMSDLAQQHGRPPFGGDIPTPMPTA